MQLYCIIFAIARALKCYRYFGYTHQLFSYHLYLEWKLVRCDRGALLTTAALAIVFLLAFWSGKRAAEVLSVKLDKLVKAGKIREISVPGFPAVLVGMTIYPFVTKDSVLYAGAYDEEQFLAFVKEQRGAIPAMILSYSRSK